MRGLFFLGEKKKEKEKTSPKAVRGPLRRRCNRESDPADLLELEVFLWGLCSDFPQPCAVAPPLLETPGRFIPSQVNSV